MFRQFCILLALILGLAGNLAHACTNFQDLSIASPDSDPSIHRVHTQDIWAIWYHPSVYSVKDAKKVADRLAIVRCEAEDILEMKPPLAAEDGYFTNVVLHTSEDEPIDDGFPNDWDNAVGINEDGYSQMELNIGAPDDNPLLDHEGFHIMQDQVDNRYEDSDAFSYWIAEASADWYAWLNDPNMDGAFENLAYIHAAPHLPFYLENGNLPDGLADGDLIFSRPYSFNALLAYAQLQTPITKQDITRGYFQGNITPQEMMTDRLGFSGFADFYANFAAKTTAMLIEGDWGNALDDFILNDDQRLEAVETLEYLLDPDEEDADDPSRDHINVVSLAIDAETLDTKWSAPSARFRPFNWGYNVVEIEFPIGSPTLEFQGKNMRLRLVTNIDEDWYVETVKPGDSLDLDPVDSAYLVVTYTPKRMGGFGQGKYRLRLQ